MRPLELIAIYAAVGIAVAIAQRRIHAEGAWAALLFWPFFLPGLFPEPAPLPDPAAATEPQDPTSDPIAAACGELARALGALDPVHAERCAPSLDGVTQGLGRMAARLEEIEAILIDLGEDPQRPARARAAERLVGLREETRRQLQTALEGITDLTTRVHLARLTGEDPADLTRQLARLAADIDAATEVAQL